MRHKNRQNIAISTKFSHFGGLLCRSPFTNQGQIWQETENLRPMLTHQISFESIYSHLPGTKMQFWANFDIWTAPVPFYRW